MAITLDGSTNNIAIGANATGSSFLRLYEDTDNGTNYVDIIAPASVTSNRTLTLPDSTGTVLTSATTTGFPAGSVIQVVSATYSTFTTSTSATYADTGLTASITPTSSSSKILVVVSQNGVGKSGNQQVSIRLFRGATNIVQMGEDDGNTGTTTANYFGSVSTAYLDSPATTSSTTYKTQFRTPSGGSAAYVQLGSAVSTITLMEIAA